MKLKITLYIKYKGHPELMEIVERAGKEIVNLAREHEDLGNPRKIRDASIAYLDKSTTDRALQIVFQNPTSEKPRSAYNDYGLVLDNYTKDTYVVDKSRYERMKMHNAKLQMELIDVQQARIRWRKDIRAQANFAIRGISEDSLRDKMERMRMTKRDRVIFSGRTLQSPPRTLEEIGNEVGLSRERVRQLDLRIISKFFSSPLPQQGPYNTALLQIPISKETDT